jgi:hypothetical protein
LEVKRIVPLEAEKEEEYSTGLFFEGLGVDDFEHPIVVKKKLLVEGKAKSVDRAGRSLENKNKGNIDEVCGHFFFLLFLSFQFLTSYYSMFFSGSPAIECRTFETAFGS